MKCYKENIFPPYYILIMITTGKTFAINLMLVTKKCSILYYFIFIYGILCQIFLDNKIFLCKNNNISLNNILIQYLEHFLNLKETC